MLHPLAYEQPVRLSFQPFIFSQPAFFFSHTKLANSTFSRLFSAQANMLKDYSAPGVSTGSELHFEVELLSWLTVVDIYRNGGIVKKVLSTGGNRQTGDLDEVTGEHSVTNSLTPYCFLYLNTNA
jgi:hypothetical protein